MSVLQTLHPTYLILDDARTTSNEDLVHAKRLGEHGTESQREAGTEQVDATLPREGSTHWWVWDRSGPDSENSEHKGAIAGV